MMWLMHRPAHRTGAPATEPGRFSERELALLPELLHSRSDRPDQTLPVAKATRIKERAA